jgi:hypothetical protein
VGFFYLTPNKREASTPSRRPIISTSLRVVNNALNFWIKVGGSSRMPYFSILSYQKPIKRPAKHPSRTPIIRASISVSKNVLNLLLKV